MCSCCCIELKTAVGHAPFSRHDELAFGVLDFEDYRRVFKFSIDGLHFEIDGSWRDRSTTEAGRRCEIASRAALTSSRPAMPPRWVWSPAAATRRRGTGVRDRASKLPEASHACSYRVGRMAAHCQRDAEQHQRRVQRRVHATLRHATPRHATHETLSRRRTPFAQDLSALVSKPGAWITKWLAWRLIVRNARAHCAAYESGVGSAHCVLRLTSPSTPTLWSHAGAQPSNHQPQQLHTQKETTRGRK